MKIQRYMLDYISRVLFQYPKGTMSIKQKTKERVPYHNGVSLNTNFLISPKFTDENIGDWLYLRIA